MQMKLTDGQSELVLTFCEQLDAKVCKNIRTSPRPITTAMKYAKHKLPEGMKFYPLPINCLVDTVSLSAEPMTTGQIADPSLPEGFLS